MLTLAILCQKYDVTWTGREAPETQDFTLGEGFSTVATIQDKLLSNQNLHSPFGPALISVRFGPCQLVNILFLA